MASSSFCSGGGGPILKPSKKVRDWPKSGILPTIPANLLSFRKVFCFSVVENGETLPCVWPLRCQKNGLLLLLFLLFLLFLESCLAGHWGRGEREGGMCNTTRGHGKRKKRFFNTKVIIFFAKCTIGNLLLYAEICPFRRACYSRIFVEFIFLPFFEISSLGLSPPCVGPSEKAAMQSWLRHSSTTSC